MNGTRNKINRVLISDITGIPVWKIKDSFPNLRYINLISKRKVDETTAKKIQETIWYGKFSSCYQFKP